VNSHGGAVWFDSAAGAGTTFYIDFPLDLSGTQEAADDAAARMQG
jgi:signal transduction histidine kinase